MPKRGNGEGTKAERRGDSWTVQITVAGRRRRVSARTKDDLWRKVRELQGRADRGILPAPERLTVGEYLERWLRDVVRHRVRPRTLASYSYLAERHITPALGPVRLQALQPAQVEGLYSDLTDRGLAPWTVRHVHNVLRGMLGHALEGGYVGRNVATIARPPRLRVQEMQVLTPADVKLLIDAAPDTRWKALLAIAIGTGARQSELLALRWADVDLDKATVRIARQLGRDGLYNEPKSSAARRTVDLPAPVVSSLRAHRAAQLELRLLMGPQWQDGDLIFCTHEGRPLQHSNCLRDFKRVLRTAGLPAIRFHDLRHTSATLSLLAGVPVKVVAERLGHANVGLTLQTYSHVLPSMGRDAADRLGALLA